MKVSCGAPNSQQIGSSGTYIGEPKLIWLSETFGLVLVLVFAQPSVHAITVNIRATQYNM